MLFLFVFLFMFFHFGGSNLFVTRRAFPPNEIYSISGAQDLLDPKLKQLCLNRIFEVLARGLLGGV